MVTMATDLKSLRRYANWLQGIMLPWQLTARAWLCYVGFSETETRFKTPDGKVMTSDGKVMTSEKKPRKVKLASKVHRHPEGKC